MKRKSRNYQDVWSKVDVDFNFIGKVSGVERSYREMNFNYQIVYEN